MSTETTAEQRAFAAKSRRTMSGCSSTRPATPSAFAETTADRATYLVHEARVGYRQMPLNSRIGQFDAHGKERL
jgi:hypothetical protein